MFLHVLTISCVIVDLPKGGLDLPPLSPPSANPPPSPKFQAQEVLKKLDLHIPGELKAYIRESPTSLQFCYDTTSNQHSKEALQAEGQGL